MADIVPRTADTKAGAPAPSGPGPGPTSATASSGPELVVEGRPIDYGEPEFDPERALQLVPGATRTWATEQTGDLVVDPVTRNRRRYQWCTVESVGPPGDDGSVGGQYSLVAFAKRGLAVARGVTDRLVPEPGSTRWRTARWSVQLDPSGLRHQHRSGEPPHAGLATVDGGASGEIGPGSASGPDGGAGEEGWGWGGTSSGPGSGSSNEALALVGEGQAGQFGHLPADTQRFLLDPFVRSGTTPQDVDVYALRSFTGRHETEELWVHLFNRRWLAFSYARRTTPRLTGTSTLDMAAWDLAAWVAPVRPAGQAPAG